MQEVQVTFIKQLVFSSQQISYVMFMFMFINEGFEIICGWSESIVFKFENKKAKTHKCKT